MGLALCAGYFSLKDCMSASGDRITIAKGRQYWFGESA
jgi:hypothetical protein